MRDKPDAEWKNGFVREVGPNGSVKVSFDRGGVAFTFNEVLKEIKNFKKKERKQPPAPKRVLSNLEREQAQLRDAQRLLKQQRARLDRHSILLFQNDYVEVMATSDAIVSGLFDLNCQTEAAKHQMSKLWDTGGDRWVITTSKETLKQTTMLLKYNNGITVFVKSGFRTDKLDAYCQKGRWDSFINTITNVSRCMEECPGDVLIAGDTLADARADTLKAGYILSHTTKNVQEVCRDINGQRQNMRTAMDPENKFSRGLLAVQLGVSPFNQVAHILKLDDSHFDHTPRAFQTILNAETQQDSQEDSQENDNAIIVPKKTNSRIKKVTREGGKREAWIKVGSRQRSRKRPAG